MTQATLFRRWAPLAPRVPHLIYGGDYNPEQWDEAVWLEDAHLMREVGVNLVSLGVFAWSSLEPRPGAYDFIWLDRVMDVLHAHEVKVNLSTATASPPPWLARLHPDSLPVTADGVILHPGARQQYSPSSSAYREAAVQLATRLAERYGAHPALAMWHVNNEYGCHVRECFSDASAASFRRWLEARYGTLDALNNAWGTSFWSQRYGEWEEIYPPRRAPTAVNPSQQLDWRRFCSDVLLECFELERAVLKRITPDVPVTTNFMGFFKPLDLWRWAEREDLVSNDAYPEPADPGAPVDGAMGADLMRSLGRGRPWILMEQTPTAVVSRPVNTPRRPGEMRLMSLQSVARGADGVMFFQWRASQVGAEKFHGAMLPHGGTRTRTWREISELGGDLARLEPVRGAGVPAETAMLLDWESWWALELEARPSREVQLLDQLRASYEVLWERNVPVDFVAPHADLSAYKLLLAPNLYLVQGGMAEWLETFVAAGGTLLMSFFSGVVDTREQVFAGGPPGPLRRLLGLRVEEFVPLVQGQENRLEPENGLSFSCDLWADVLELESAEAIARFGNDFFAGRAAATRHSFGLGAAYYLATRPDAGGLRWLLERALNEAGVRPTLKTPRGVEVVRREGDGHSFLFVMNHAPQPVEIIVPPRARDLLGGDLEANCLRLPPKGVAVLEVEQTR